MTTYKTAKDFTALLRKLVDACAPGQDDEFFALLDCIEDDGDAAEMLGMAVGEIYTLHVRLELASRAHDLLSIATDPDKSADVIDHHLDAVCIGFDIVDKAEAEDAEDAAGSVGPS